MSTAVNRSVQTHKDVSAVDELLQTLLGDQQHLIKQEEGSLLLHSVDLEGTFQNQLSKPAEVRPAPVHQLGLNFLRLGGERSRVRGESEALMCATSLVELADILNSNEPGGITT